MSITYNTNLIRENDNDQTVYFVLTDSALTEYQWWADIPLGVTIQDYLDAKEDEILLLIRRREYPGGVIGRDYEYDPETQTELEAVEAWILAGAPIKDDEGTTIGNVTYVPWETSPAFTQANYRANKGVGTLMDRLANLENAVFGE